MDDELERVQKEEVVVAFFMIMYQHLVFLSILTGTEENY